MGKFTWENLLNQIKEMDKGQLNKQVCVSIDDDSYFTNVTDIQFIQEDIYVNIEDSDEVGTLEDLRSANPENFNIENYKLCTPKGTPFLWDGF